MLRKAGENEPQQLHICLTDFGFSKELEPEDPNLTIAGNPGYSAPEVLYRYHGSRSILSISDWPKADLFSLGKIILTILWRTKETCQNGEVGLHQPPPNSSHWVDEVCRRRVVDPQARLALRSLVDHRIRQRIPAQADDLIKKLMHDMPEHRGNSEEVIGAEFFGNDFAHLGEAFDTIDFQGMRLLSISPGLTEQ